MEPTTSFSTDPQPGVIIQCAGCKTIVGDTSDFVSACTLNGLKLLTVKAATDVTVDKIPQKLTVDGQDSTYFHICCLSCGNVIGKMFTHCPTQAKLLINSFSFDASKCKSYRLGSADITVSSSLDKNTPTMKPTCDGTMIHNESNALANSLETANLIARIDSLETEMLKMQGMILLHDGQLQQLPGYHPTAM